MKTLAIILMALMMMPVVFSQSTATTVKMCKIDDYKCICSDKYMKPEEIMKCICDISKTCKETTTTTVTTSTTTTTEHRPHHKEPRYFNVTTSFKEDFDRSEAERKAKIEAKNKDHCESEGERIFWYKPFSCPWQMQMKVYADCKKITLNKEWT